MQLRLNNTVKSHPYTTFYLALTGFDRPRMKLRLDVLWSRLLVKLPGSQPTRKGDRCTSAQYVCGSIY